MTNFTKTVNNHIRLISLTIEQVFRINSLSYMEDYILHITKLSNEAREFSVHDEAWNVATNILGYGNKYDYDKQYNILYNTLCKKLIVDTF